MIYFPRAAHFYFLTVSILAAVFQTTIYGQATQPQGVAQQGLSHKLLGADGTT